MFKFRFLIFLFSILFFSFHSIRKGEPDFISIQNRWVDSVFKSLSSDERLAQLFMVAAYSNKDMKHVREIKELIAKYNIGGLIWMQGGPVKQGKLANYYQGIAKTPLLYSMDAEWGLAMRLDSTPRYPKQMTLGAIQNDSLIYLMGKQIGSEFRRIGMHVNFAPVANVNNNPLNPVIGMRSFGENKFKVAHKCMMYMNGMQDLHVMANGKHFPGHGDTESDSHTSLPIINHTIDRLDSLELYPFKFLFENGLSSVMVAHLNIPSLDTTKNLASTLSSKIVTDLLKTKLNYKGLIFTDALNMKGVAGFYEQGMMDVKALIAGNDVLLFSGDVPRAIIEIKKAIKEGKITSEEIDNRCKKILKAKYWCGLYIKPEIITRNLSADLNVPQSEELISKLSDAAITVVKNDNDFLPLKNADTLKILEISFGVEEKNGLFKTLSEYSYVEHAGISHDAKLEDIIELFSKVPEADLLILHLNKATAKPENNYGIGNQTLKLIDSLSQLKPSILTLMTSPYILNKFISLHNFKSIIVGYEFLPSLSKSTAEIILGKKSSLGLLPVSTNDFKAGFGIKTNIIQSTIQKINLKETDTQKKKFGVIDSIAQSGINQKAYPGCQIVAMQNGEIIYQRSFGHFTYSNDSRMVDNSSFYDLASLTKVLSSSLALMKLSSEKKFDYKKTLGSYLPDAVGTNKENLIIEDILTHQSGLQPFVAYYLRTLDKKGKYKPGYYSKHQSEEFPIQVAKQLFTVKGSRDSIYNSLLKSKLENTGKYVYSDVGYYFMQKIIEQESQKKLNEYVNEIYTQMGTNLSYLPLNKLSKTFIAPTEQDKSFRKQLLQGYVHDPGAALIGGVAGHAGLFGNATDVAMIMQLYLNKGERSGKFILDSNVVKDFTSCHFCPKNRRGLCFEKPEPDEKKESPVAKECSNESFGHSGFTGTLAWADPKNKLVFVFLSNRIYPNADENKLAKLGIRGKIHKAFYEALK